MNKLYLITGPAGVGKSTISEKVAKSLDKSVLIEGDAIYNFFVGGRISPWKDNAPIELFWQNSINLIKSYLDNGYDVVFNYIINKNKFEELKDIFKEYPIKFILLLTTEEELLKRDQTRPIDCRMNERCLVLLHEFINQNFDNKFIIDTSNNTIDNEVNSIINDDRFIID